MPDAVLPEARANTYKKTIRLSDNNRQMEGPWQAGYLTSFTTPEGALNLRTTTGRNYAVAQFPLAGMVTGLAITLSVVCSSIFLSRKQRSLSSWAIFLATLACIIGLEIVCVLNSMSTARTIKDTICNIISGEDECPLPIESGLVKGLSVIVLPANIIRILNQLFIDGLIVQRAVRIYRGRRYISFGLVAIFVATFVLGLVGILGSAQRIYKYTILPQAVMNLLGNIEWAFCILSMITNMIGTGLITMTFRFYRQSLTAMLGSRRPRSTSAQRAIVTLIDSGMTFAFLQILYNILYALVRANPSRSLYSARIRSTFSIVQSAFYIISALYPSIVYIRFNLEFWKITEEFI